MALQTLKAWVKSQVPLVIKLAASQTANALEVKNSAGTVIFSVGPSGAVSVGAGSIGSAELDETLIRYAAVSLTAAQVNALRATPIELVAAPGAGKILEFVSAVLILDATATGFVVGTNDMAVKYTNGAGALVSQAIETTGFLDQTADTMTTAEAKIDAIVAKAGCENQALVLHNTGASEFTTGTGVLRVKIAYRTHTSGW